MHRQVPVAAAVRMLGSSLNSESSMDALVSYPPRTKLVFTDRQLAEIQTLREHHPDPRVRRRLTILWLRSFNETNERIAQFVDLSRRQVQRVLKIFSTLT